GELLALRWQDVDLHAGAVQVTQAVEWVRGKPIMAEPKTTSSRRAIPLTALAIEALKRHRARQAEERLAAGPLWQDSGRAFTDVFGEVVDRHGLAKRAFPRLTAKAGVKRVRFHDLRHTAATFMLAEGLPVKTVQRVLGHATATMTLDRYGHVLPNSVRAAASVMDSLLSR
ncbi:MAG: site-specific integrase, partial [Firmicutes bacterium]|nr:site-specific integrase [Bacillota bacterium]